MAARRFQIIELPSYSLDLAPAGKTLTQETLEKEWEGAVRTLSTADFVTAFRR